MSAEQPSESHDHMDDFYRLVEKQDEREAHAIDDAYAGSLPAAIIKAHKRLKSSALNETRYGFEVAHNAKRWWNYRNAHLLNLKPIYQEWDAEKAARQHGLESAYSSYEEKLDDQFRRQRYAGEKLALGDASYVHTFAALETERRRRQIHGEPLVDPLELEYEQSMETLAKALDQAANSPRASGPAHSRHYEPRILSIPGDPTYSVRRDIHHEDTFYTIEEAQRQPLNSSEFIPEAQAYGLAFQAGRVIFTVANVADEIPADSFTALDVASAVQNHL